ncbi:hypothetical protein MKW94_008524 [Papaver nudicaule]|uniref:Uncharacterized protein n=1 Tax=Papaver nudicaule TaxID=74823 RepID=A0AA41VTV0_PAPNU|nr:hypothetical protein [Papaver nudicaule]
MSAILVKKSMGHQITRLGAKIISSRNFSTKAKEFSGETVKKPGKLAARIYGILGGLGISSFRQYHNEGRVTSIMGFNIRN